MHIAPHKLVVGPPQVKLAKLVVRLARVRIPGELESVEMFNGDGLGHGRVARKSPHAQMPTASPVRDEVRLLVWIRQRVIWRHQDSERGRRVNKYRLHRSLTLCLPRRVDDCRWRL